MHNTYNIQGEDNFGDYCEGSLEKKNIERQTFNFSIEVWLFVNIQMYRFFLFFAFVVFYMTAIVPAADIGVKIVNGDDADIADNPWQVSVQMKSGDLKHECGGVIIDNKWILSAAHCYLFGPKRKSLWRVGAGNSMLSKMTVFHYVKALHVHEQFQEPFGIENDIMLIELKTPLLFGLIIQKIKLDDDVGKNYTGVLCKVSGWGDTNGTEEAAHCYLFGPKRKSLWRVGAGNSMLSKMTVFHYVKALHVHEQFQEPFGIENDIMLIELKTPLLFGSTIQKIKLDDDVGKNYTGVLCKVSGWGDTNGTEEGTTSPDHLQVIPLYIVNINTKGCFISAAENRKTRICAQGEEGKDACQGDSGGPLVCSAGDEKTEKLMGIVSYGHNCDGHVPSVYSKVSAYIDWIRKTMNKRGRSDKQKRQKRQKGQKRQEGQEGEEGKEGQERQKK
ncbi:unnamed protein product [Mytilus coruscus]|uniref:Peptidase S1 domain-containing protein n=1 Tax=Mytilus coruscus TaxID=42192 RepID=A0A6J8BQ34_MYTCO|nr:unnamed protein product [Mytilus coruscus]